MQRVAAILRGKQLVIVGECKVVERGMILIAEDEDGNRSLVPFSLPAVAAAIAIIVSVSAIAVVAKLGAEDGAPGAARGKLRNLTGRRISVARRREEEGAEIGG